MWGEAQADSSRCGRPGTVHQFLHLDAPSDPLSRGPGSP